MAVSSMPGLDGYRALYRVDVRIEHVDDVPFPRLLTDRPWWKLAAKGRNGLLGVLLSGQGD